MCNSIAQELVRARTAAGLTQKEFATLCDMRQEEVSRYETGLRKPRIPTLLKIASRCKEFSIDSALADREMLVQALSDEHRKSKLT